MMYETIKQVKRLDIFGGQLDDMDESSYQKMNETFMALVDAFIPRTPLLAEVYGMAMFYGALDLLTDKYLVMILNYYYTPLEVPVSEILNILAKQLINSDKTAKVLYSNKQNVGNAFSVLSPRDRLRSILLIEEKKIYFSKELAIFIEYPGLFSSISSLNRYIIMGFYSEWYGYGTTRFLNLEERTLQFHPISWEQVGYPGPTLSYLDLVKEYYQMKENRSME